ncbi:MAG: phosphopantetheine-binding protein [Bacteroidota bacterium]
MGRRLTLNEKLYSVASEFAPPFAIQFILKGKGKIDLEYLAARLDQYRIHRNTSDKEPSFPAFFLAYHERKGWSYDGGVPSIILHQGPLPSDWNHPFFREAIDLKKDSLIELHIFRDQSDTLVFKTPHTVMDAKGGLIMLQTLLELSWKESPSISASPYLADHQARKEAAQDSKKNREGYAFTWAGPNLDSADKHGFRWATLSFEGPSEGVLAQVAHWFAQKHQRDCRFLIPVDIRRHSPKLTNATSNLSLPIYLQVSPNEKAETIQAKLLKALQNKEELYAEPMEAFGRRAPNHLLRSIFSMGISKSAKDGLFPMSGILSDIGKVDLGNFTTSSFQAEAIIPLPVYVPLAPFCMNILRSAQTTHLGLSMPAKGFEENVQELKSFVKGLTATSISEIKQEEPVEVNYSLEEAEELRGIWSDILEISLEEVAIGSNFQELGGDSLSFLTMLNEVSTDMLGRTDTAFLNKAMDTAGKVSIPQLLDLVKEFSKRSIQ